MRNITTGHKCAMIGGHEDITANEVLRIPVFIRDFHMFYHEEYDRLSLLICQIGQIKNPLRRVFKIGVAS